MLLEDDSVEDQDFKQSRILKLNDKNDRVISDIEPHLSLNVFISLTNE